MSKPSILIIEDEENIQELVSYTLGREGFATVVASSGEEGLRRCRMDQFNLVLLDLMLPGIDGLEVCRELKKDIVTRTIPVIMVTAKGEESDVVAGLELGADDYLIKPFSPKILVARIKAVLRRKAVGSYDETASLVAGNIQINPGRFEVLVSEVPVKLTNLEFRVLHLLASRTGWVFTRNQIVEAVRGDNYPVTDRAVDVMIVGLRKKLGESGDLIETVRGVGYRFREQ
jgi:two-component system phosphate regulon response regulator PhoB